MANQKAIVNRAGTIGEILDTDTLSASEMVIGDEATTPLARLHVEDNGTSRASVLRVETVDGTVLPISIFNETANQHWSISSNFFKRFRVVDESAGLERFVIDDSAHVRSSAPNFGPLDEVFQESQISLYLDEVANNLVIKSKYSDSTVKLGTVALDTTTTTTTTT